MDNDEGDLQCQPMWLRTNRVCIRRALNKGEIIKKEMFDFYCLSKTGLMLQKVKVNV